MPFKDRNIPLTASLSTGIAGVYIPSGHGPWKWFIQRLFDCSSIFLKAGLRRHQSCFSAGINAAIFMAAFKEE